MYIADDMLGPYNINIKKELGINTGKARKPIPNLLPKRVNVKFINDEDLR